MIWVNTSKQLTCLVLLLFLSCTPCLAEQLYEDATASSVDTVEESVVIKEEIKKPGRSRLKYRNGPVCMCNDGLSEAEIHAAWLKRFSKSKAKD